MNDHHGIELNQGEVSDEEYIPTDEYEVQFDPEKKETTFSISYDYLNAMYSIESSKTKWPEFLVRDSDYIDTKIRRMEELILEYHQPKRTAVRRFVFLYLSIPEWLLLISFVTLLICLNATIGLGLCTYYYGFCENYGELSAKSFAFGFVTIKLWIIALGILNNVKVSFDPKVKEKLDAELAPNLLNPRHIKTSKVDVFYKIVLARGSYDIELHLASPEALP